MKSIGGMALLRNLLHFPSDMSLLLELDTELSIVLTTLISLAAPSGKTYFIESIGTIFPEQQVANALSYLSLRQHPYLSLLMTSLLQHNSLPGS